MSNRVPATRLLLRSLFFLLFVLAPVLDIFRLDLSRGNFIIFGSDWTLNLLPSAGQDATSVTTNLLLRLALPVLCTLVLLLVLVWRYGRIYCGWLCPHFSMVELLDQKMQHWLGRRSVWEKPSHAARRGARLVIALWIFASAFLWAVSLLSYLWPPLDIWRQLWDLQPQPYVLIFLLVATTLFALEFTLARHWFCRYGCAVGIFQSLIWSISPKALVIHFQRQRGRECRDCHACDQACPMRLPARARKQRKITCTQCGQCVSACHDVQRNNPAGPLLHWQQGEAPVSARIPVRSKE
ncbi:4Fe-4S binding protein [Thalassolituus marinus]|uniref:4Fe-4S binding protein n=1 Tax=Thalassolituus marinus TaxID=671053 RepID=A0ABS7ZT45_9GAMM|nr:4Fe-4S binding protein [Thalassolituus marinus]MCA6063720.1 4Fe-4S binding protein [Thalassolituus marinus]